LSRRGFLRQMGPGMYRERKWVGLLLWKQRGESMKQGDREAAIESKISITFTGRQRRTLVGTCCRRSRGRTLSR